MIHGIYRALALLALSPLALAQFVPDDVIVSDPASDLRPPEFDARTLHMTWQDGEDNLWLAHVHPVTGTIDPIDGKGILVDTNLSDGAIVQNTPRYTYGTDGAFIVYNKRDGLSGLHLAKAFEIAPDVFETSLLENGDNRYKANGSPEETMAPARIVYNRDTPEGDTVTSWRTLNDPSTEQSAVGVEGGRFLGGEPSVVLMAPADNGIVHIFNIPFDTGIPEQVTFGHVGNFNAFIWYAPEFQDYLIATLVGFQKVGFYRRINGVWTKFYAYRLPTAKQFVSSEEALIVNGRSFLTVVAAEELGAGGFGGQPVGPTEIWVTSIDPFNPMFRRVDDPSYIAQRSEPEPFTLRHEVVIYHTELVDGPGSEPDIRLLKRARTGLSQFTGYNTTAYGGPWASSLRDNKNCACTPYPLGNTYVRAASVQLPNSQFMHPVLGPERQLYFGIVAGGTRQLVAVNTMTGTEAFRLDETQVGTKVSATTPLITSMGEFYVAANDALRKFSSKGVKLWEVATKGLARGPQFLPDGNVLLFTWNGWAHVVSPTGQMLLETDLTEGRTFPADPTCLRPVMPGSDCAYVGPPAVQVYDDTVYVTQVRSTGDSVVQAFRYEMSPAIALTDLWQGASPVVPGVATAPVLSANYDRLYVQDGAGNLNAYNAIDGALIWTFPLGFVSDQSPVVTAGGFILPGGTVDQDANYNFVGILRDNGTSAAWTFQNTDYVPRSFGAAGGSNRFVLAARENATGNLKLLVMNPSGVLSTADWGNGAPTTLKGVTIRDDGWIMVQTLGQTGVKLFKPTS